MNLITTDIELRELFKVMINKNGVMIPLSQRSEKGLEFFKMTNGYDYVTYNLDNDGTLHYVTNIKGEKNGSFIPHKVLVESLVTKFLPYFKI